ncbi:MAG: LysM peptidoglycan-binding domain-containing protein [Muribaculum sp.]|nr:LysM peptidoglycan-binding domain-containing protein [Muribaculum sp.]
MNKFKYILSTLTLCCAIAGSSAAVLPEVTILGRQYYRYEAKKGDSLYGIAKEYGWDQALITSLNPELSSPFKEGQIIYYPVPESKKNETRVGTVSHQVAKGETVYGISKKYNVSTEQIYAANPGSEFGIKEGQTLTIPTAKNIGSDYVVHKIMPGETLYGVAKRYNTSVEDIMYANPGVSDHNFKSGDTVKILPDSRNRNMVKESVVENHVLSLSTYKVGKNDTWEKVSKKFKVDTALLQEANPGVSHLEKGKQIIIPNAVAVNVMKDVAVVDPRESTPEGRQEIYEDVQKQLVEESKSKDVRVALVLNDLSSNMDMEFSRGFLMAIDELKKSPYKITVKIIEENSPTLITALTEFGPSLIITTNEKELPGRLVDYAASKDCELINSFDVKSNVYETNGNVVHILPPSSMFNAKISKFISDRFGDRRLIILGEPDSNDTMAEAVLNAVDPLRVVTVPTAEIKDFNPEYGDYLIYITDTKRADVKKALEEIKTLREKAATTDFAVLGRPNLITQTSYLNDLFCENEIYFPSRFYFDPELSSGKKFIDGYKDLYSHTPIKSFPVYAISGYDIARYFIPAMHEKAGELDKDLATPNSIGLQNGFNLQHADGAKGLVNDMVYMIKFNPFGNIDKITIE